ncbi:MAG: helix-turn-helix domain-containing protein, partial [Alistipes sp.]|nr:helix-turn-helix domain-containing protein [Alistipes sp.]
IYAVNFVVVYDNKEKMDTEELLKQIGNNIRLIRESKGVLQQDLADLCNFDASNMSRIEKGRINFTVGTLNKIAHALEIPFIDLVTNFP